MKILLVDEDINFSNNLTDKLLNLSEKLTVEHAETANSAIDVLHTKDFDFILTTVELSDMHGVDFIKLLQKSNPKTPIFVLYTNANAKSAVQSVKAGATDFIDKATEAKSIFEKFTSFTQTKYSWQRGFTIDGFVLQDFIAETLTSIVFTATKENDPELYAVKAIRQEEMEVNEQALQRFTREVDVINKINHPNIIKLNSFGVTEDDIPYMIMPFIKGSTLEDAMPKMSEIDFLDIMLTLLDTLWDVHKHNIIHRDIKPDNIMFYQNLPILLDFGTVLARSDLSISREGSIIGTPNYMAPETFSSDFKVDYRSDIYSLGIILYKYVYKKCPYDGENFREIYRNLQTLTEEDIFHGSKYDKILKELIKKNPNERHDSVLTIYSELMEIKMSLPS